MKFSLEITVKTDIRNIPKIKNVYITMLPGEDYKSVVNKVDELLKAGFNPVPQLKIRKPLL